MKKDHLIIIPEEEFSPKIVGYSRNISFQVINRYISYIQTERKKGKFAKIDSVDNLSGDFIDKLSDFHKLTNEEINEIAAAYL